MTPSSATTSGTVWQTRLSEAAAETYERDLEILGLDRSEALRQGLRLLHRAALEQRTARDLAEFYDGGRAPLSEVTETQYRDRRRPPRSRSEARSGKRTWPWRDRTRSSC